MNTPALDLMGLPVGALPLFLRDLIACPPRHGGGVHQWIFRVARNLHPHRPPEDIEKLIAAALVDCGRPVPRNEIRDAIRNSTPGVPGTTSKRVAPASRRDASTWPPVAVAWRTAILASAPFDLIQLRDHSPLVISPDQHDAEWMVDHLFPGNPLLCLGSSARRFRTKEREKFRGNLGKIPLIVPSPMSAVTGARKTDGKQSEHTLDNTGPRWFLVIEFDSGTTYQQAALHWHLGNFAPLVLVVSSGGKSLHGWFKCDGIPDDVILPFMRYAVSIGADPATWCRTQFVRLPQGLRAENGKRQEVVYFNPEKLTR